MDVFEDGVRSEFAISGRHWSGPGAGKSLSIIARQRPQVGAKATSSLSSLSGPPSPAIITAHSRPHSVIGAHRGSSSAARYRLGGYRGSCAGHGEAVWDQVFDGLAGCLTRIAQGATAAWGLTV